MCRRISSQTSLFIVIFASFVLAGILNCFPDGLKGVFPAGGLIHGHFILLTGCIYIVIVIVIVIEINMRID